MPRGSVAAALALFLAFGCEDATFDLFPAPGTGQNLAGDAGKPPTGPSGGYGGTAGFGAASGNGNIGQAGADYDDWCGPNGCQTLSTPYCAVSSHRCVACRLPYECPPGEHGCDDDCDEAERCYLDPEEGSVPECAPDCRSHGCPSSLPACDMNLGVCRECSPTPDPSYECTKGLHCNWAWKCVECTKNEECERSRPICDFRTSQCRPCQNSIECNPPQPQP